MSRRCLDAWHLVWIIGWWRCQSKFLYDNPTPDVILNQSMALKKNFPCFYAVVFKTQIVLDNIKPSCVHAESFQVGVYIEVKEAKGPSDLSVEESPILYISLKERLFPEGANPFRIEKDFVYLVVHFCFQKYLCVWKIVVFVRRSHFTWVQTIYAMEFKIYFSQSRIWNISQKEIFYFPPAHLWD